jgi:hypothetical protein
MDDAERRLWEAQLDDPHDTVTDITAWIRYAHNESTTREIPRVDPQKTERRPRDGL